MYIPEHFAVGDLEEIGALVDRAGAADLVTFDGTSPVATLLPLIWERPPDAGPGGGGPGGGGFGRLLGHIALQNPQWRTAAEGAGALAIVHGPQGYISPSWYASTKEHGRVVPTWNYTAVHFTGQVTFRQDPDWLRDVVTRLTERHEACRACRWWIPDAPEKYMAGQLRAIVGVEFEIARIEAVDKLSQNRTDQDRANVIAALRQEPDPGSHQIAEIMEQREASR